ncbi:MAG TPA: UbiA family prenyltransferase [bacterium]|nr:UbiA family prenyltransferase [bacterium]
MLNKIAEYLSLYRADAAAISFISYLFGLYLSGGFQPHDILKGLLITLISFNFIYSFNSWSDRAADRINKPQRPIPRGGVSPVGAFRYAMALLATALLWPLILFRSAEELILLLLLPLLGLSYSLYLKRNLIAAAATTAIGLILPMCVGRLQHDGAASADGWWIILTIFLYCVIVIPLKDIGDHIGDVQAGRQNWSVGREPRSLVNGVLTLQIVPLLTGWSLIASYEALLVITVQAVATAGVLIYFLRYREVFRGVYRAIIATNLLLGGLFTVYHVLLVTMTR